MGWLVEHLLKHRTEIKSNIYDFSVDVDVFDVSHLEKDDQYNDLLIIENKIKDLYNIGLLSDFDIEIIDYISDGKTISDSEVYFGKYKTTISKHFSTICGRIAYFLGGHFTNEGFIDEIATKRNLTKDEIDKAKKYIKSKYKHSIMRSQNFNETTK